MKFLSFSCDWISWFFFLLPISFDQLLVYCVWCLPCSTLSQIPKLNNLLSKYAVMYHQHQNKWYPKSFYLSISKLDSILAVPNLLAHNNITISCHWQVNSLLIKWSVALKWASRHLWGGGGGGYHFFMLMVRLIDIKYENAIYLKGSFFWTHNCHTYGKI